MQKIYFQKHAKYEKFTKNFIKIIKLTEMLRDF